MGHDRQPRLLAVGIDAAEPTFVRELIARGELPVLGGLLERGRWAEVDSRADFGSGAVWPTFFTGGEPVEHGICNWWAWRPQTMSCVGPDIALARSPFWSALARAGDEVGVLDVPFAPPVSPERGFEVLGWGPHDDVTGDVRVSPGAARRLVSATRRHPFASLPYLPGRLDDRATRTRLSAACLEGARRRGDLATRLLENVPAPLSIVVFTEVHHVAHHLWHTVAPSHPLYADDRFRRAGGIEPTLVDVHREVDRQVGRVIEAAGPETATVVFSLHGMAPGPGIPTILAPLLTELGLAPPARWGGLSWRDRGLAAFASAKRRVPRRVRSVYDRVVSQRARQRLAQPTIVPPHDWSRTRVFALPTDQHGTVRVNLRGREARGVVPGSEYDAVCDELEHVLRTAATPDGEPIVEDVVRPAREANAPPESLPDLIVHWSDAAHADPLRATAGGADIESHPIRLDLTGRHTRRGFLIADDAVARAMDSEVIAGRDIHRLLLAGAGLAREAASA